MIDETYDARRGKESVVAVLLATMSFTAVFTIPGGFKTDLKNGEREKMLGMPILIAIKSFKMLIIFDCLAFFLSLFVVLMWQTSSPLTTGDKLLFLVINNLLVCASYACTACGFMAAVYTMLEYKHGKLARFMFLSTIIVGRSAILSFIYLSARFSVKLARFNCVRGVGVGVAQIGKTWGFGYHSELQARFTAITWAKMRVGLKEVGMLKSSHVKIGMNHQSKA